MLTTMRVILFPILLAAIQSQVKLIHPCLAIMMLALSIGGAGNMYQILLFSCLYFLFML